MKSFSEKQRELFGLAGLLMLSVVCYWKMLDNYLFLDDTNAVYAGYLLKHDISKIFTYYFPYIYGSPLYRFVVALSYVPNYLVSGADPWSYYVVSLLLHFGNGCVVYFIVKKLSGDKVLGFLVSALFLVSMNKSDAVLWMAARTTIMGSFFILLTIYWYVSLAVDGYNKRRVAYCLLSFFMALGCYETALMIPLVMTVLGLLLCGRNFFNRKNILLVFGSWLVVIFLIVHFKIGASATGGNVLLEATFTGKLQHMVKNIISVFPSFAIRPDALSYVKGQGDGYYNQSTVFTWLEYLSVFLLIPTFIYAVWKRNTYILAALALFFILSITTTASRWTFHPLTPYDSLRFSIGRYSYTSSLGFFMIAGYVLHFLYCVSLQRFSVKAVQGVAVGLALAWAGFNITYIYEREKLWHGVTDFNKKQIESIVALQVPFSRYPIIYTEGLANYDAHSTSLFRVLYDNPKILTHGRVPQNRMNNFTLMRQNRYIAVYSSGDALLIEARE